MSPAGEDLAREYRLNLRARLARIEQLRRALAGGAAPPGQYVAEHCSARPGPAEWAEVRALLEKLQLLFEGRA